MALDRALLERMGQLLRELPTDGYPNLTKPELRELAATARALTASAEAEIEARPVPFPAELRPALVMQWLPLREVPAALRVASSWCRDSEQYFRRFAQREGILRGGDSWQASVRSFVLDAWRNNRGFVSFQQFVFSYYAKHWAKGDSRFIPIDEVVAAHKKLFSRKVRRSVVSLVCFGKLNASPTGQGHRLDSKVAGFEALTPLQLRVLKCQLSDPFRPLHKIAVDLGPDLDQLRTTVDYLVSAGHLSSRPQVLEHSMKFLSGLPDLRRRVLDYYATHATSDVGLATDVVAAFLSIDLAQLQLAVASLSNDGYLYSTIDDDHYKSTVEPIAIHPVNGIFLSRGYVARRA